MDRYFTRRSIGYASCESDIKTTYFFPVSAGIIHKHTIEIKSKKSSGLIDSENHC